MLKKLINRSKGTRGITLVALIITVIVMLILAGVAISVIVDGEGLFSRTRSAAEEYEQAAEAENTQLQSLMNEIDKYINEFPLTPEDGNVDKEENRDLPASTTTGEWIKTKEVNSPKLASGMIPIYWNADGEEIELTSEKTEEEWGEWYNYTEQTGSTATAGTGNSKWANAITKDNQGNITGYYVWIPRFAYKITSNLGTANAGEIDIKFLKGISNEDKEGIVISKTYPNVISNAMEDYVIHPAFTSNTSNGGWGTEIPGFWIAKYPAGFQQSTVDTSGNLLENTNLDNVVYSELKYTAPGNEYTDIANKNKLGQGLTATNIASVDGMKISYPVFKPLTYAYNLINIDSISRISQQISSTTSFYGLSNADTHLMKNSEWGAVAYLTWSAYGRNATVLNKNNVRIKDSENNSFWITGIYADSSVASHTNGVFTGNIYNTSVGQLGSSTGNITGVYDMNGCVWEYVAAYIENEDGKNNRETVAENVLNIGLKYKTIYKYDKETDSRIDNYNANNLTEIFGDAILETSYSGDETTAWNGNVTKFTYFDAMFFARGGSVYENNSGIFAYDGTTGAAFGTLGFRIAIIGTTN